MAPMSCLASLRISTAPLWHSPSGDGEEIRPAGTAAGVLIIQDVAYSREDIDRVRQATNLVELVGAVTKVKRSGRSHMAICPFHQEKSPSMSIDPGRGLYHCFGCQKGGDVFTFLEETQGLDFNEAVEELARRAGIPLESD